MAMFTTCRVIREPPARGTWNMAVDEALLEEAAQRGILTLRLYRWSKPTLSLGYFQPLADRAQHATSAQCPIVRRPSGGGAILHDRELTYSLTLPGAHPLAQQTPKLYDLVHECLIGVLLSGRAANSHFRLARWANAPAAGETGEPFLCFERRAPGDVVLWRADELSHGYKIIGSAQRRRHGAVLQHGSILLHTSEFAPQLPGFCTLTDIQWDLEELAECVAEAIAQKLQCAPRFEALPAATKTIAVRIESEKHDTAAWINRR